ncbi:MAG: FHA domain-containing protein [Actinomycetota bacterium]
MPEIVCARCGHPNSESSNYCSSCGFDLRRSLEEETSEIQVIDVADGPPEEPGGASFVVKRGHKAGSRFVVNDHITTIGRHPESDIFLDDVTVSRRHAEVRRDGAAVMLEDVGSLNGTYLNRSRIETSALRSGDEVQVGKFKLVFLTEDA